MDFNEFDCPKCIIKSLILLIFIFKIKNFSKNKIKVCICTVGKEENKYIREFIAHYKKIGIDKIFLYDNNDINNERFEPVIQDYIKDNYVQIFNVRGKTAKQLRIYRHCYRRNNKYYNWLVFYDIDEYINLKNIKNIKDFLNMKQFEKCQSIYLNWIKHTDNNLLFYDNRTLKERFPDTFKNKRYCLGKTIIRGNIIQLRIKSTHVLDKNIVNCNGFGETLKLKSKFCRKPDLKYYYIDHYEYKSLEEFIDKINKGDCLFGYGINRKLGRIHRYFKYNNITLKKFKFMQEKINLNITQFMKYIKYKY